MYKDIVYISGETEETSIRIPVAAQDLWELVEKPAECTPDSALQKNQESKYGV